jgi:hypothetical protein
MRIKLFEQFVNEAYDDYGTPLHTKWTEAQDELVSLQQELKDLKQELKDAFSDMENDPKIEPEGGKVADEWGGKLNDIEENIEKKKKEIEKLEAKIYKMENPAQRKNSTLAATPKDAAKHLLMKNIEDIKISMRSWPDRTIPQQAEIYKKRYKLVQDVEDIAAALTELEAEKKIIATVRESQLAEAAILTATNKRLWTDIFASNYLTEEEKEWFSTYLSENNIEGDINNLDESLWDTIKKGIEGVKDSKVGKAIVDKVGKAMDGAKRFAAYIGDLVMKAWTKLIEYFKNKFKGVKETIKKDYEKAKEGTSDIATNIKQDVLDLKDTMKYWTVDMPKKVANTITGKFAQEIVKECLMYNGTIINELSNFDEAKMDQILMSINEADDAEEGGDEKADDGHGHAKGSFGFLNKMAHAVVKWFPFNLLAKIKELGTKGAKFILSGFSAITKKLGGPGVYEFAVISLVAGGALELYLKHKGVELLDKGLEDVISAQAVLKIIPMAKTIIHALELTALFLLIVETVAELADLEGEIEKAH